MPRIAPKPELRVSPVLPENDLSMPIVTNPGTDGRWKIRMPNGSIVGSYTTRLAATEDIPNWIKNDSPSKPLAQPKPIDDLEGKLKASIVRAEGVNASTMAADFRKAVNFKRPFEDYPQIIPDKLYTRVCPGCNARSVSIDPNANGVCEVCDLLTAPLIARPNDLVRNDNPRDLSPSEYVDIPENECPNCANPPHDGPCKRKNRINNAVDLNRMIKAAEGSTTVINGAIVRNDPEAWKRVNKLDSDLPEEGAEPIKSMQTQTTVLYPDIASQPVQFEIFGHRSGAETHMQCPRRYFLNYAYLGTGITPTPEPIYFVIGTAVHIGLANILSGVEIDPALNAAVTFLHRSSAYDAIQLDSIKLEQTLLVTGLIQSFWTYAWPSMKANYEFLHIEHGIVEPILATASDGETTMRINMMSRPDFIARLKSTGEIVCGSWKTIDDPTQMRKTLFANDLQGLTEMHWGEMLLKHLAANDGASMTSVEFFNRIQERLATISTKMPAREYAIELKRVSDEASELVQKQVHEAYPTTIDFVQMIYLVKGKRVAVEENQAPEVAAWFDDVGLAYDPAKVFKQDSPLCYQWVNTHAENRVSPKSDEIADKSHAYRYYKPGNVSYNNLGKDWVNRQIESIEEQREWIQAMHCGMVFPSTLNDERNAQNPLAKLIVFDEPMYRNGERARRFSQQQRDRFVEVADKLWTLGNTPITSVLDQLFPQSLTACRSPYRCAYLPICESVQPQHEVIDFMTMPEGFVERTAHHEAEREFLEGRK